MKVYYFSAFVLAVLQPQIGWLLLPAIPVALAASKKESNEMVFLLAFVAGFLADLFSGSSLGISSIFLLLEAFFVQRLGVQFQNSIKLTLVVAVVAGIICQVVFRNWLRI